ncbi:uncharacterized protein LOC112694450 [Sipha flava]|uniref:Uncharacterized protein LOC112694450 n=1 Tax=Sipha flava TaxID=143950 RepID=A0A8B8GR18_9HEMI|nr:uncharacterized protein LOC112694450 [Sipha flava]
MDKWLIKKSIKTTDHSTDANNSSNSLNVESKSEISQKKRVFQEKWLQLYPWLLYDRVKEKSFCSTCSSAVENKVDLPASSVPDQNFKNAFVVEGFSAWNKALERFKFHEGMTEEIVSANNSTTNKIIDLTEDSFSMDISID